MLIIVVTIMVRVRVRINGNLGGAIVKVEENMTRQSFIAAAKRKLLQDQAQQVAVDDSKVVLYLEGGFVVDDLSELESLDIVAVAFSGSGYKDKFQAGGSADSVSVDEPLSTDPRNEAQASPAPPATPMAVAPPSKHEAIALEMPLPSAPRASCSRQNVPDTRLARPTVGETISKLQTMAVYAGLDFQIRTGGAPAAEQTAKAETSDSSDAEGMAEGVMPASAAWMDASVVLLASGGWKITCRENPSLSEQQVDLHSLIDRFDKGEYRAARPPQPHVRQISPSLSTARKRSVRRSPEEIKQEWDALIASGIARPAGPADNPEVWPEESEKDLFCNPCGKLIMGTGGLYNCSNFVHSHGEGKDHKDASMRFQRWENMFNEEIPIATRIPDPAGVNGYSIFNVGCSVCPSPRAGEHLCILTGNTTRYCIELFKRHCKSVTHVRLCESAARTPMPKALMEVSNSGIRSFFPSPSSSAITKGSQGAASSGGSSSMLETHEPMSHTAVVELKSRPCAGLVSGPQYYSLAICFSEKATAKIGQTVDPDAKVEYVCIPNRVEETASVHLRTCSMGSLCEAARKSNTVLISAIKQRAERAALTMAKIDVLDSLLQGQPPPAHLQELLKTTGDAPDRQKFKLLFEKPEAGQVEALIQVANGQKGQLRNGTYSLEHQMRLELILNRYALFKSAEQLQELKAMPQEIKHFVGVCAKQGVEGQNMCRVMDMYVSGKLQDQAVFGMLMGAVEKYKKDARNVTDMRGIRIQTSVFNFLIGLSQVASKRAVKFASLNLLGFEINLSNTRKKITTRILGLQGDERIELIDPTDEQFELMMQTLARGLRCGASPLIATHMDPSKLAGTLQYCSRRQMVLGGDALAGYAKMSVTSGTSGAAFIEAMSNVVPADQANIFAFSPAKAGFPAVEAAALPERHCRKGLSEGQMELLKGPTTAFSVFSQVDRYFSIIEKRKMRVASFGCDGGVHGMAVIDSLHRTNGMKPAIIVSREIEPMGGTLLGRFGVELVICKTKSGILAGVLDPSHILKRVEEQFASGVHFVQIGPRSYCSFGFWREAGVPSEIIVKPDAMSDKLTRDAFSSTVMKQLLNNSPTAIDPSGTIIALFLIGESIDAAMLDGLSDIERVARLYLGEALLTAFREFSKTAYKGNLFELSMAALTLHNYQKMCNAYLAMLLEWQTDYPNDPYYAPAHGSLRLETRFSIRRGQCESFGLLDLANHQLRDLAVSSLVANGDLKYQTNNKGYVSHEERDMAPTSYRFTPKLVLRAVMVECDDTARSILRLLGMDVTPAGEPATVVCRNLEATETQITDESIAETSAEAQALAAENEVDALMMLGDVAAAAERAKTGLEILGDVSSAAVPAVVPAVEQDPAHLEESSQLVAATIAARELDAGIDPEGEADEALQAMQDDKGELKVPFNIGASERGAGATTSCSTQDEQRKSLWLEKLRDALRDEKLSVLIDCMIAERSETEKLAGIRVKTLLRTPEEAKAHEEALSKYRSKVKLHFGDQEIDPAQALRLQRQGVVEQFNAQRKRSRLQRWIEGTKVLTKAGISSEEAAEVTIRAGEVWLYAASATRVVPAVVIPFHTFKNGVRPWTSLAEAMKLKDTTSVQLVTFKATSISTTRGGLIFRQDRPILERFSRRLMFRFTESQMDLSGIRESATLELLADGLEAYNRCRRSAGALLVSQQVPLAVVLPAVPTGQNLMPYATDVHQVPQPPQPIPRAEADVLLSPP